MADVDDIQPLVCDNGTGMVKVWPHCLSCKSIVFPFSMDFQIDAYSCLSYRLALPVMMHQGLYFPVL